MMVPERALVSNKSCARLERLDSEDDRVPENKFVPRSRMRREVIEYTKSGKVPLRSLSFKSNLAGSRMEKGQFL